MRTRRTIIETAILALAVLVLTGIPALAGPDEDAYARGRNAVFEERWKDVKEIFDDFSRRFPGSPHTDDAQYWLGMALYEMGQPERAYDVLEQLNTQHTDSPWIDDARVLMVRCAETILKSAPAKSSRTHVDRRSTISSRPAVGYHPDRWFEYEDFLEKSTLDKNAKVQLLAIDTILISRPEKAPDLLPRITRTGGSRQAAGMVLDRFFGPDRVKLTMGDPALGLTEENVDVMVRTGDSVAYLSLSEAVDLVESTDRSHKGFSGDVIAEIRDELLRAKRSILRAGDLGPAGGIAPSGAAPVSTVVQVVDGEVHYYRDGGETARIVVLQRAAGFNHGNVRIFVEKDSRIREIPLEQARRMSPSRNGFGLSAGTIRYIRAALAVIEIDLSRDAARPSGHGR